MAFSLGGFLKNLTPSAGEGSVLALSYHATWVYQKYIK
jgi:hypothetical protein